VPTHLGADRSTMVCAQCHSLRDQTVPGFAAGRDYFDHFMPVLEFGQKSNATDPAYWPDGGRADSRMTRSASAEPLLSERRSRLHDLPCRSP
jgi:hypothetical protein